MHEFFELAHVTVHLQQDLSYLSPNGRQIMVEEAGHMIHIDQPQAVIDAIREVVETARDG